MTSRPALFALLLLACDDGSSALYVDLRSDLLPGIEFTEVITTVESDGGTELGRVTTAATASNDFVRGMRIADFTDLARGSVLVHVAVRDRGALVSTRDVLVTIDGVTSVTLLVTRDCRGVVCGEGETCHGGHCVDPSCTHDEESCGTECDADADCVPAAACAIGSCEDRTCIAVPRVGSCALGEYCDPELDCQPLEPAVDAGMTDAGMIDAGRIDAGMTDAGMIDAGPDAGPMCPGANELFCGGACVDTLANEAHCGTCGRVCGGAMTCWVAACGYREMMHWVNERRAVGRSCGSTAFPAAGALTWEDRLASASQRHANDMAARDIGAFYTSPTDGSTPESRLMDVGYAYRYEYQQTFAKTAVEPLSAVADQLFADPGICAFLMDPRATQFGAGAAVSASGTHYWAFYVAQPN